MILTQKRCKSGSGTGSTSRFGRRQFTVTQGDIVRLIGMGIAGSKIEAKVEGSAKIETTSNIKELSNGKPLIGNQVKVFDLKPTGPGKVTATITVTPPQPSAPAKE